MINGVQLDFPCIVKEAYCPKPEIKFLPCPLRLQGIYLIMMPKNPNDKSCPQFVVVNRINQPELQQPRSKWPSLLEGSEGWELSSKA